MRTFSDDYSLTSPDLFFQFAQRSVTRGFAVIDTPLRHLPIFPRRINAAADEDQTVGVQQHDPDTGAIGTGIGVGRHSAFIEDSVY